MDSLQRELQQTTGIEQAEVLNYISYEYLHINQERSLKYAKKALQIAKKFNH